MRKLLILIIPITILLTGCANVDLNKQVDNVNASTSSSNTTSFKGTKGDFVVMGNDGIAMKASSVNDGKAHFFNTTLSDGKPVYFFVVKSPDGKLRAAANGCQVCGKALQGFRQVGNSMVCNTCGNSYPLDKISTEKGGCNPAPINPDLQIKDGNINITESEIKNIQQFF